jgi:hypothetical protein
MPTNDEIKVMIERLATSPIRQFSGQHFDTITSGVGVFILPQDIRSDLVEAADTLSALLAEREEAYSAMIDRAVNEGGAVLMNSEGGFEHIPAREFYAQKDWCGEHQPKEKTDAK